MANIKRFVVERTPDQIPIAFRGILNLCNGEQINSVTLVVPQKGRFLNSNVAEFLGPGVSKALSKGQRVEIAPGVTMTLESGQTFRSTVRDGLLVGAHISMGDMNKLDDSHTAQAILYLPWNDEESQEWQATWHPETMGPGAEKLSSGNIPPAVAEALSQLTQSINLGTGLGHPSDKRHAENVIAKLHVDGHSLDPVEIRRWAQRNGWSSEAAAELEAIAKKKRK